jgi:hypothetical protein
MLIFNKYFYKNKKSKLYFVDRVAVLRLHLPNRREYLEVGYPVDVNKSTITRGAVQQLPIAS